MMPGWQRAPQFGMGYGMQYPAGVVYVILTSCILCPFVGIIFYLTYGMLCQFQGMQGYPQAAFPQPTYQQPVYPQHAYPQTQPQPQPQPVKASNPFDLGNEPASIQAHMV